MKRAIFGTAILAIIAIPVFAMAPTSGLKVGEMTSAFEPTHVAGPDKGTETCPVCKYGNAPAVQIWHKGDTDENIVAMINHLETKVVNSKKDLKAFTIRLSECEKCVEGTVEMSKKLKATHVGVTYLPITDPGVELYKINTEPAVKNTVMVYKNRKVVATFVNLKADEAGFKQLDAALAKAEK